LGTTAL
jgi:hypothetical protein